MPSYGTKSLQRLNDAHPALQRVFHAVIQVYDCSILETSRTLERQQHLYNQRTPSGDRLTHIDGITQQSKHQRVPSEAVDAMPWPQILHGVDIWEDKFRWNFFGGLVLGMGYELGIQLRWGGDWNGDGSNKDQKFHDLPHFELLSV